MHTHSLAHAPPSMHTHSLAPAPPSMHRPTHSLAPTPPSMHTHSLAPAPPSVHTHSLAPAPPSMHTDSLAPAKWHHPPLAPTGAKLVKRYELVYVNIDTYCMIANAQLRFSAVHQAKMLRYV